jgi:uncharacterized membrane protein
MSIDRYRQVRTAALLFMVAVVAVSLWFNLLLLAGAGFVTGILFLVLLRPKGSAPFDERAQIVRDKAAAATYAVFAATIGISAVLLLLFSRRGYLYLEAVGLVFTCLTLFLIALYAISHYYFDRKYGGGGGEE